MTEVQLPKGWNLAPLSDLVNNAKTDIVDGPFGSNLKASEYTDEGVPIIRLQNIARNAFIDKNIKFVSTEKFQELRRHTFVAGDIIITKLGYPLGEACVVPVGMIEGVIVADVVRLRVNEEIVDKKYVCYGINSASVIKQFDEHTKGTTRPRVNLTVIRDIKIPLPHLHIQRQVVAKIEELFSELEAGVQELQTALKRLKVYRKLILNNAITGVVTSKWRSDNENVQNSDHLFTSIQLERDKWQQRQSELAKNEGRTKSKDPKTSKKSNYTEEEELKSLPEKWNYYRLEDICYLVTDGTHFTPKYQDSGVTFLSVKNVRPFEIKDQETKYISQEEYKLINKRCNPEKGDILYTKIGATYGYAAQIKKEYKFSIFVSLALIKPVQQYVLSDYLELVMNSELIFKQARRRVSGSGVPDLHLIEIRDFKVPLPPIEEQRQIVAEALAELSEADAIELVIKEGLIKAEALGQSILKQAFEGKLVKEQTDLGYIESSITEFKAIGQTLNDRSGQLSLF